MAQPIQLSTFNSASKREQSSLLELPSGSRVGEANFQLSSRPIIGVTANFSSAEGLATMAKAYYQCIERAGGTPVLLPPTDNGETLSSQLEAIDGILFTGGGDINPLLLGEEPEVKLGGINGARDRAELFLAREAYRRSMPMFGICRGMQVIAAALGGKIAQDISGFATIKHSQNADRQEATHTVSRSSFYIPQPLLRERQLSPLSTFNFQLSTFLVNSFHHQAVVDPGDKLCATAHSQDDIIEEVVSTEHKPIFAVQWHPENLYDSQPESSRPYFQQLISDARVYARAKKIHQTAVVLDSHCDTPMMFEQPVDLNSCDDRVQVDFVKMGWGRVDVANMVCYLPQPKPGEKFADKVSFPGETPREYCDYLLDLLRKEVEASDGKVAFARTAAEVWQNKLGGVRSIMLGLENGLGLMGDIENVKRYHDLSMKYITLCHNGDNDICDSAKGSDTHGGLSDFGKSVVKEMNRLGMLIDLSHASESTFYDVLKHSSAPVVCSHSNCRALCDHPRNLTDEQMRLLAEKGGLMHITFYEGFLTTDGKADISDVVRHIKHAVEVMGAEHVGVGSDFDGGGGVPGLDCTADFLNLTQALIREGFSDEDITRILGGNWISLLKRLETTE